MRSYFWSQDLMTLRFFTSGHRKATVREKVIGKKRIYLERAHSTDSVGQLRGREALKYGAVSFCGLGNFIE